MRYAALEDCFGVDLDVALVCAPVDYTGDGVVGGPDYTEMVGRYGDFVDCFGL